jgi:hypothetical protein
MLGLCSVSENPGPSRPAPRDGAGAKGPQQSCPDAPFAAQHTQLASTDIFCSRCLLRGLAHDEGRNVQIKMSQVFPGKSQHDACLNTHQAEDGSQMEKNNAELLLSHVIAPNSLERSSLLQNVYTNLTAGKTRGCCPPDREYSTSRSGP